MPFNWPAFLQRNGIPHIESGSDVKRGNINIKCPFCGPADLQHHMGLNLANGWWGCWRDRTHRGKGPVWLIMALLGVRREEATAIASDGGLVEDLSLEELSNRVGHLGQSLHVKEQPKELTWPEFQHIRNQGLHARFWRYLLGRGFHRKDIAQLCRVYGLAGCLSGYWANRLIIPFWFEDRIVGWTGRAIGEAEVRYLSHPSSAAVKQLVLGYDGAAKGGNTLAVVEGPLDWLKVDYYGRKAGLRSVAILGTAYSMRQVELILALAKRFTRLVVLLDPTATASALRFAEDLAPAHPHVVVLPSGVEDPGALTPEQVVPLVLGG